MSKAAHTLTEGTHFLHKELWRIVGRQLDHGMAQPTGSFYDNLVAMVFALHTLEAYLNFVGDLLAPDTWKDERKFFRIEPYRGFDGKLRKVLELVGISEPARDIRPYSTVWFLKDFRDLISHAKPERFKSTKDHSVDEEPQLHHMPFDERITRENAERARDDIAAFIEMIHVAAKPRVPKDKAAWFGSVALEGLLQIASGHTILRTREEGAPLTGGH